RIIGSEYSLQDYNRAGIPLIEIVSAPDLRSPEEARLYLERLKAILQYTGVSDCKMEEGSLRCDANISLRPFGQVELGTKIELKNMNSFRAVQKALEYEVERQARILDEGGTIVQETRAWDEARGVTVTMRTKEEAQDYRYFPEPDLVPLVLDPAWIEEIRRTLPELPAARQRRFQEQYGLPAYDAALLTESRSLADWFEEAASRYRDPKTVSNWVMGEFLRLLNAEGLEVAQVKVKPGQLVALLELIDRGTISGKMAKGIFEEMFHTGEDPEEIVRRQGLVQITDAAELSAVIDRVLQENPKSVEDFRAGKEKALGFLVGQVMRATGGRANPGLVNELLRQKLNG
ncbi:MAG: Asp-tRNA(Asn)/Glu-tRNA(Gln) amidotransferase subunit GatB, partial [Bacillota bacterium]|nr:Asp-tRNA(Asn)/Glu-tRNA(Gln) amidotransferase subunit GatB [Bacillota bacterium]